MILLGIETATELVGVAVADASGPRAAAWATGRRRHAESLAPAIVEVCAQAGIALSAVETVAVDLGPGLFTGLRVGVATAKGLAQGLGIGVIGVSSLEVLAEAAFDAGVRRQVVSVVDARRGEVFAARFAPPGPDGRPVALEPAALHRPEDLAAALGALAAPPLALGDGARRYRDVLAEAGVAVAGPSLAGPPPAAVVTLAARRLAAGEAPLAPGEVHPLYLRQADVRINWAERQPAGPRS